MERKSLIEAAFADRNLLAKPEYESAVETVVADLDTGKLRVATRSEDGKWTTHAWVKQAVLLYFAIARMERALAELRVVGVETSASFHRRVMREPDYRAGRFDIRYLESHPELMKPARDETLDARLALAAALLEEERRQHRAVRRVEGSAEARSGWRSRGWR